MNWTELESKYYMHTVARTPVTIVKGKGARVWDDTGKEYLDFVGGLAVDCLGHCHPATINALTEQAQTLIQTSNLFYTTPQLKLAQMLVENSCLDKVFVCNSGLEANEGAVKLARRYGALKLNGAYEVITMMGSFHGRSLAMTAASGNAKMHEPYPPLPAGFVNVPNNDIEALKAATSAKTCAVMMELIQAEGGINMPAEGYVKAVRQWCDEKGILLILDEVQTGIGRLGALFGYELYGIEPDIITLAKGLGGGVPIGAFLAKEKANVFAVGDHNATFGGNPLTSAAALGTLEYVISHKIPANAQKVGDYLIKALNVLKQKYSLIVKDVRGQGLLVGIEFHQEIGSDMLTACLERGLLVNRLKPNALRFIPPLIITERDVDEAVAILDEALSTISK